MINPKGKHFSFEYDNTITDRVINGISDIGISNEIKYDSYGNPISTKIINHNLGSQINNGLYKIRLKGTKQYIRYINNSIVIYDDNCNHDLWNIEVSDDYYKIYHSIILNKYLTVQNNSLILSEFNNDSSLFTLVKNNNGSYLIKLKDSDNYLKFNENTIELAPLIEDDYHYQFYLETTDNPLFIENNAEYTGDGRFIKSTTDTLFNKTLYDIDPITGLTKSVTNAKGETTYYNYNDKRQLTSVTTGNKNVTYTYNNQNLLSSIIQDNKQYKIIYDEFLNPKTIKIGDNITLVTNNYESNNGKLLSTTYGNDHNINFDYDDFNRIKTVTKMNDTYNYKYGNNGDLIKIISNNDIIKYTYDSAKRLSQYRFNDFKIKYTYDSNENIINTIYNLNNINNNVENIFNDDDSIIKTIIDNNEINYNYDNLGRIINSNINNQFNTNYTYLTNGKRTSLIVKSIENNNDLYSYKYDKLNNITHIYHNDILENKYYYDSYNQLIKENNYITNEKIKYNYDNTGNIISKKVYNLKTYNFLYKNKYEYNNTNWMDQLTKYNDDIITYDEIGNPLTIGNNIILNWINGRQLNSYVDTNNTITYKYNKDSIRTSKIVNNIETKYYLEGKDIIFEKTNGNVLYFIRNEIDGLIGFKYNNDTYYYIKNNQDDIIGILDDNYNVLVKYTYDSWGNIISILDNNNNDISCNNNHIANINPYRYRSYYYDKETNLYYLNSRYYNPIWGRFINADSYISTGDGILGYNMYAYCNNNPIAYIDILGRGILKNAVKKIAKKIKNIGNEISKGLTKVKTVISKGIVAIKNAFVFEVGTGVGLGGGIEGVVLGKAQLGFYEDYSIGYQKGEKYKATSVSAGISTSINNIGELEMSTEYNHILHNSDDLNDSIIHNNPFSLPWEVYDCEYTNWEGIQFHYKRNNYFDSQASKDGIFIGVAFDYHIGIGGHIKIGFNIN